VDPQRLRELLAAVAAGQVAAEAAAVELAVAMGGGVDAATLDRARADRTGVPEVVLGEWKTAEQIAAIVRSLATAGKGALATRVSPDKAERCCAAVPARPTTAVARADRRAGRGGGADAVGTDRDRVRRHQRPAGGRGGGGQTAAFLGAEVVRLVDVGVAGLHRLLARIDVIRGADAAVIIAGMEGALPSVVAGLVDVPLFAVPTSVGYGVGAGGLVALAAMLSSCAPGVAVVNIDNGFGAAVAAVRAARMARRAR
jgi:NCAIR mutase (PurE)-related protein